MVGARSFSVSLPEYPSTISFPEVSVSPSPSLSLLRSVLPNSVSLLVLFPNGLVPCAKVPVDCPSGSCLVHRPGGRREHSLRASLEKNTLPWAPTAINHAAASLPENDAPERGCGCAKVVDSSISGGNETSCTARTPCAGARFAGGKRRDGRPSAAKMPR